MSTLGGPNRTARDEVGGRAVNLLPSETVQDIYGIVAKKVNEILQRDVISGTDDELVTETDKTTGEITEKTVLGTRTLAGQWLAYGVNRSVTKRSVMTLAYGSKEFGFRQQVLEDTIRPAIDSGKGLMFTIPNQAAGRSCRCRGHEVAAKCRTASPCKPVGLWD
ncbi:RNA polymerase [Aeromonas phage avDM11-UST]|nr:RNA polymerase [Aeromonas phage avDM11-UST]